MTLQSTVIVNGRVVTPTAIIDPGHVVVDGDTIVAVAGGRPDVTADREVDAEGRLVLPGLVDLHGDELERYRAPRPGATVPLAAALSACDRANAAAGITTKFHAVAFEQAPDDGRSLGTAKRVLRAIADAPDLLTDAAVHARCELADDQCPSAVESVVADDAVGIVSLMNHEPGKGQFAADDGFVHHYTDGRGADADSNAAEELAARRASVDNDTLATRAEEVVAAADEAGVPTAVHDPMSEATVEWAATLGIDICEYPTTIEAAAAARDREMPTVMGAPNLVRGESLWGNLSVREAIESDVLDSLCSDFYPRALLLSVFCDESRPLPERVARVSARPAAAAGLTERGRIEPGARADLLVVDEGYPPTVLRSFVAGEEVYRSAPPGGPEPPAAQVTPPSE